MPRSSCVMGLGRALYQQHHNHQTVRHVAIHAATHARVTPSVGSLPVPQSASLPIITALPARHSNQLSASCTSFSLFSIPLPSLHLILVEIAIQPSQWTASLASSLRSCRTLVSSCSHLPGTRLMSQLFICNLCTCRSTACVTPDQSFSGRGLL
jgi:hypothetical protein